MLLSAILLFEEEVGGTLLRKKLPLFETPFNPFSIVETTQAKQFD